MANLEEDEGGRTQNVEFDNLNPFLTLAETAVAV
jgi:hypothetical protein